MSREEAIKLIDNLKGMIDDTQGSDYDKAFNIAIADMQKLEKIEQAIAELNPVYPWDTIDDIEQILKDGAE